MSTSRTCAPQRGAPVPGSEEGPRGAVTHRGDAASPRAPAHPELTKPSARMPLGRIRLVRLAPARQGVAPGRSTG